MPGAIEGVLPRFHGRLQNGYALTLLVRVQVGPAYFRTFQQLNNQTTDY